MLVEVSNGEYELNGVEFSDGFSKTPMLSIDLVQLSTFDERHNQINTLFILENVVRTADEDMVAV